MKSYKDGTVQFLDLSGIQIDKKDIGNRALDKDHVKSLADSIGRSGLDNPIIAWNGGEGGGISEVEEDGKTVKVPTALLIAGFHRLAAIKSIKRSNPDAYAKVFPNGVPVSIKGGELKDALTTQLRENVQRKDLDSADALTVLTRLRDEFQMSNAKISRAIGKTEGWVSQVFSIEQNAGTKAVDAVKERKLTIGDASKVAANIKKAKAAGKKVSEEEIDEQIEKAKSKRQALKDSGRSRGEKRIGAKALYKAYIGLPKMNMGRKHGLAEAALAYLAGESDTPPDELVKGNDSGDE